MPLSRLVQIVWTRKWKFFLVCALITGAAIAYCFIVSPVYETEAAVLISEARSERNTFPDALRFKINSQIDVIESEDVLRSAIASVGAETLYPPSTSLLPFVGAEWLYGSATSRLPNWHTKISAADSAYLTAKKQLKVAAAKDSQAIRLSFRHQNPKLAERFLGAVVDEYLKRQAELSGNSEAPNFFRQQAAQYKNDYERAALALSTFAKSHSTFAVAQEIQMALTRRDGARAALTTTQASTLDKEAQVATLQSTLSQLSTQLKQRITLPAAIFGPRYNTKNRPETGDDTTEEPTPQASPQASPQAPQVSGLAASREPPAVLVRVFQETGLALVNLNAAIGGLRALEDEQKKSLAQIEAQLTQLSTVEAEFSRLKMEVDQAATILDAHVKQAAEAQVNADWAASEKLSSVKVLQRPSLPIKPVFPQKTVFAALGLFVGLLGGLVATAGPEMFRRNYQHSEPPAPLPELHTLFPDTRYASASRLRLSDIKSQERRDKTWQSVFGDY